MKAKRWINRNTELYLVGKIGEDVDPAYLIHTSINNIEWQDSYTTYAIASVELETNIPMGLKSALAIRPGSLLQVMHSSRGPRDDYHCQLEDGHLIMQMSMLHHIRRNIPLVITHDINNVHELTLTTTFYCKLELYADGQKIEG